MAARMNSFEDMEIIPSRPVSDDEDDEQSLVKEDEDSKRKIHWIDSVDEQYVYIENENQQKMVVEELIVGDGMIASAFLYTYFLTHYPQNVKIIGQTSTKSEFKVYEVNYESSNENKTPVPTFRSNYIYLIHLFDGRKVLICQLFNQLKSNELYDWLNQLWAKFEYKSSLIISSQNRANYFTSKDERFPCVKFVTSDPALNGRGDDKVLGRLEEPNFLNELPAAIIHFGLGKKIPFTALVCYTNSLNVDLQSVKEIYRAVSSQSTEKTLFIDNEQSKKTLLSIENAVTSTSGLYI